MTTTELRLFRGGCSADGFIEGSFDKFPQRINAAREQVNTYLCRDWGWEIFGDFSLAKTLPEAEEIVKFLKEKLPEATDLIIPLHCAHGLIVFNRLLSFPNTTIDQVEMLISQLNTPGVAARSHIFGASYDPYLKEKNITD